MSKAKAGLWGGAFAGGAFAAIWFGLVWTGPLSPLHALWMLFPIPAFAVVAVKVTFGPTWGAIALFAMLSVGQGVLYAQEIRHLLRRGRTGLLLMALGATSHLFLAALVWGARSN